MDNRYGFSKQTHHLSPYAKFLVVACSIVAAACQDTGGSKPSTAAESSSPTAVSANSSESASAAQTNGNSVPVISGTPATTLAAGAAFNFSPQASDADGDTLAFSISNKPSWATFNTATGRLSGTPNSSQVGSYGNVVISVSDGKSSASLPAFSVQVTATASASANAAPVISGSAVLAVNAEQAYNFVPTVSDANGDALTFSIANKPSWATFDASTGELSGTPSAADVGTYSNVVISVSDSMLAASLPAFAISVTAVSDGTATLSWTPPTQNTDGTALTNLAGYRIHYGTNATSLDKVISVNNAGVAQYVVENLSPATWYFAVKAVSASGAESDLSATVSKKI